jgi:predicted transcriptional regulator of viral defense system
MPKHSKTEQVLALARKRGMLRARDLKALGIPGTYLHRLVQHGRLERLARGLYRLPGHEITAQHGLAQVCAKIPHGVVCLLSALQFHELTTQWPPEVWIAIDRKGAKPTVNGLPVRVVRFSGAALRAGVEERQIEGVTVRVTNPAKTVADCFKYRNKLGQDVALEALRDCWRKRKATVDELWQYAKVCRVAKVMRPYMESLV